jgi:hypothetical protein
MRHTHILCLHPNPLLWQRRAPLQARIPPVTLINESKTSSGKGVANDITLAVVCAPAKKVAPSAPAPDVAPPPIFLNNP